MVEQLQKSNKEMSEKLNNVVSTASLFNHIASPAKTTTNFNEPLKTVGPRLQKINEETNQIVKVYETVTELLKENSKYKRPSIEKAVQENTVYHGFRFMYVDRELDPNVIYNMEPTKQIQLQEVGYVAKLDIGQTEILNVFLDDKTTSNMNNNIGGLDNRVKNGTLTQNNHFIRKMFGRTNNN